MAFASVVGSDGCQFSKFSGQVNRLDQAGVNRALITVAQEVMGLLNPSHSGQNNRGNAGGTVMIRAVEPEYRKMIATAPLTARELEVLQLIVDGYSNSMIAQQLYIATGTVKSHVCSILNKLCVNDRTQAAIRGLRSGLVH